MKKTKKLDIDGVIFDLGSTILEYETIPWSVLDVNCFDSGYEFLKKSGAKLPHVQTLWNKFIEIRQNYRNVAAASLREWSIIRAIGDLLKAFNIHDGKSIAGSFFDAYYAPISKQLTLFADAHSVLDELKSRGMRTGLVSNTIFPEECHLKELNRFNLIGQFDFLIFSVTFGYRKPHPSIYQRAIELMEAPPERLLFVGDRFLEDVHGPRQSGMSAILKYREGREYPDPLPDGLTVIESLTELLSYVRD
jgi:HAD superfamily hydrolase (TIGR01549 family)